MRRVHFKMVTLRQILSNQTSGAISRSVFFEYLKGHYTENVLEFWVAVQDYYNQFEPENPRSSFSLSHRQPPTKAEVRGSKQKLKSALSEQRLIAFTYIQDESPMELNLQDQVREEIISKLEHADPESYLAGLFDKAQFEAEHLLEDNYLHMFLEEAGAAYGPSKVRHTLVERRTLKAPSASEQHPHPERPGRIRVTVVKRRVSEVVKPKTTLSEVLHLKTSGPLARSAFYRYLERRGAAKYIRFWVEVQDYVNTFEPLNPRSDYARDKIKLPERWNSHQETMGIVQDALFEKYIERDPTYPDNVRATFIYAKKDLYELVVKRMKRDPRPSGIFDKFHVEVEKYLEQNYFHEFLRAAQERMLNKKFTIVYRAHPPIRPKSMAVPPVVTDSTSTPKQRARHTSDKTGSSSESLEQTGPPRPKDPRPAVGLVIEKTV